MVFDYSGVTPEQFINYKCDQIMGALDDIEAFSRWLDDKKGTIEEVADDCILALEDRTSEISEAVSEIRHVPDWISNDWAENEEHKYGNAD